MKIKDSILDPFVIHQDHAGFHVKELSINTKKETVERHCVTVNELGAALGYIGMQLKLRKYSDATVTLSEFAKFEQEFDKSLRAAFEGPQTMVPLFEDTKNGEQMDITTEKSESIETESAETVDLQSS